MILGDRILYGGRTAAAPPFTNLRSLSFNGVNQYVDMGNVLSKERTDPFSFSVWAYHNSVGGFPQYLSKQDTVRGYQWGIRQSDKKLYCVMQANNTTLFNTVIGSTTMVINTWYHLVWTSDGTGAAGQKFYVNGSAETMTTTQNSLGTNTIVNTGSFKLGVESIDGVYMNGLIDEVTAWNRVLTPSEVTSLYNSGHPGGVSGLSFYSACLAWWRFEPTLSPADSSSTIYDRKASLNGTPQNMTSGNFNASIP